jgi:integrase
MPTGGLELMRLLTDTLIKAAKPKEKPYPLPREAGLFVMVFPSGSKLWRYAYTFGGRESMLSLGDYRDVPLVTARRRREDARRLVAAGIDPSAQRRADKAASKTAAANTFEIWAEKWFAAKSGAWSPATADKARFYLDSDLLPALGGRPMNMIRRSELIEVLKGMENRGAHNVARKCRGWLFNIFRFAVVAEVIESNPATDLVVVAAAAPKARKMPHIAERELPQLLRAIDAYSGAPEVRCALQMQLLTAARPGELRSMSWSQIDLQAATWTVPAERMKMRRQHVVPLPDQAVAILRGMRAVTGGRELVFASPYQPRKPMSENTLNVALGKLGYKARQTAHGFRHLISTALNERSYNRDWIERQLAHGDADEIRDRYNGAEYLTQRRQMMQAWANELDAMRNGTKVTALRAA